MKPLNGRIRGFANREKSQIDRSEAPGRSKFIAQRLAVVARTSGVVLTRRSPLAPPPDPAHDGGSFGDGFRGWRAAPDRDATARGAHDGSAVRESILSVRLQKILRGYGRAAKSGYVTDGAGLYTLVVCFVVRLLFGSRNA